LDRKQNISSGVSIVFAALILLVKGTPQARVHGEVRDAETGRPLANVIVHLTNGNVSVRTGEAGRYVLLHVPAGPQHISYRLIGFAPRTLDALVPSEGQVEIHVALQAYPVQLPQIEVSTRAVGSPPSGDQARSPDYSISPADLKNHPLLAEPDVLQAMTGGDVLMDPEAPNGVHIRGGGSDQTAYLVDGIPIFNPFHVAGTFTALNPDAIADAELSASNPTPGLSETLSGVVAARTRAPGDRHTVLGSISTSPVRATLDGPIGGGVHYLLSGRTGFVPGFSASNDASQLGSEATDWLGKLEFPLVGGTARVLGYYAGNEISADAAGAGQPINPDILRNDFSWRSLSAGAEISRTISGVQLRVVGWNAGSDSEARWNGDSAVLELEASRRDLGLLGSVLVTGERTSSLLGVRLERSRTDYTVRSDSAGLVLPNAHGVTPVQSVFGQHSRSLGMTIIVNAGASLSRADGRWFVSPRVQLQIQAATRLRVTISASRLHQFGQSLRNPESVVGLVFPPDLYLGVATPGVPVPRVDQAAIGLELTPAPGMRINLLGYGRMMRDILLVAPGEPEPFATRTPGSGDGRSRGIALRMSFSSRRVSLVGNYGIQRVRVGEGASSYAPAFAPTHVFDGGVTVFPTATSSIRVGASGASGRSTTIFRGVLEWEACNLLDQGCEFAGSPHYGQDPLGGAALPAYFRIDVSLRKHWHVTIGGREAMVALFGTVTNVLGRHNLLAFARSPGSGALTEIEMRPLSPLVVGVDWRF
jgi:hypothetical protein